MKHIYREAIYANYMSNGFGDMHSNEKHRRIEYKYFEKNYIRFIPKDKESNILDLGCGCGEFVQFLSNKGYKNIVGVDTSEENIDFCKNLKCDADFVQAEGNKFLEDHEQEYDCIIFNDTIEHLDKDEIYNFLMRIFHSLKKGGCVLIKTPNMANPFVNSAGRYIDYTHETGFTEISMKQLLKAVGFENVMVVGTDIYVLNPIVSVVAKIISKIINVILFLLSCLYGRNSLRIYEKDILAIAYKGK